MVIKDLQFIADMGFLFKNVAKTNIRDFEAKVCSLFSCFCLPLRSTNF